MYTSRNEKLKCSLIILAMRDGLRKRKVPSETSQPGSSNDQQRQTKKASIRRKPSSSSDTKKDTKTIRGKGTKKKEQQGRKQKLKTPKKLTKNPDEVTKSGTGDNNHDEEKSFRENQCRDIYRKKGFDGVNFEFGPWEHVYSRYLEDIPGPTVLVAGPKIQKHDYRFHLNLGYSGVLWDNMIYEVRYCIYFNCTSLC